MEIAMVKVLVIVIIVFKGYSSTYCFCKVFVSLVAQLESQPSSMHSAKLQTEHSSSIY